MKTKELLTKELTPAAHKVYELSMKLFFEGSSENDNRKDRASTLLLEAHKKILAAYEIFRRDK